MEVTFTAEGFLAKLILYKLSNILGILVFFLLLSKSFCLFVSDIFGGCMNFFAARSDMDVRVFIFCEDSSNHHPFFDRS